MLLNEEENMRFYKSLLRLRLQVSLLEFLPDVSVEITKDNFNLSKKVEELFEE